MKNFSIHSVKVINWISNYWTINDYRELLTLYGFPNPVDIPNSELLDSLKLAISWNEPEKSAEILLRYRFQGVMSERLINFYVEELMNGRDQYWGEFYIGVFSINQLLRSAYNEYFTDKKLIQVNFNHKGALYYDRKKIISNIANSLKSPIVKNEFKLFFEGLVYQDFEDYNLVTWQSEQELLEEYSIVAPPYCVLKAN